MNRYSKYCKPSLAHGIYAMGLDKVFHKAEAGKLFFNDEHGNEQTIIDMLGGYGAALVGHNHPLMIEAAKANFEQNIPFHNQFSLRDAAGELAERLNGLIKEEMGINEDFMFSFTSTGAESVEIAIKHAEMSRRAKLNEIYKDSLFALSEVRRQSDTLTVDLSSEAQHELALQEQASPLELEHAVAKYNQRQMEKQPCFVALKNAFHGKLMTSIQLTHGEMYRAPFAHLNVQVEFIAIDELTQQASLLQQNRSGELAIPRIRNGKVHVEFTRFSLITALLVEPIQGEGGINCLTEQHAQALYDASKLLDSPIISDEIQAGSGRCGSLLSGSQIGLKADYIVLSKALGGGVCKIGLVAIRKSHYHQGFDIIQSSTFGEDDHSARVALKFLDELYKDDQAMLAHIRLRGEQIKSRLHELQKEFPDLIVDVRGRGLLLGVEFNAQYPFKSLWLKSIVYQGFLGYMVTGYLFNNFNLRVAPSSSAANVVRLEPTIDVNEEDINILIDGLKDVCRVLTNEDSYYFLKHLTCDAQNPSFRDHMIDCRSHYQYLDSVNSEPDVKVAFVNHLISADWLPQTDPAMEGIPEQDAQRLIERLGFDLRVCPFPPMRITSKLGTTIDFTLYPLSITSEQISHLLANNDLAYIREAVSERAQAAQQDGCIVAGFGMFTSVLTNNCKSIRATDIALTSGNALTVGMTKLAVLNEAKAHQLSTERIAVIGSAGNIGSTYASVMAEHCQQLVLIGSGRMGSQKRLSKAATRIYSDIWQGLTNDAPRQGIVQRVAEHQQVKQWLSNREQAPDAIGAALLKLFGDNYEAPITTSHDIDAAYACPLIVCATNASEAILDVSQLQENALVCDVSIPHNLSDEDLATRSDITCIRGGVVSTPNGESLDPRGRAYLEEGQVYACMAESILMGFERHKDHYSYGDLSKKQVDDILATAEKHGLILAGSKQKGSM